MRYRILPEHQIRYEYGPLDKAGKRRESLLHPLGFEPGVYVSLLEEDTPCEFKIGNLPGVHQAKQRASRDFKIFLDLRFGQNLILVH